MLFRKIFGSLFFLFCFFPYVVLVTPVSDIQPYAMIMAMLICAIFFQAAAPVPAPLRLFLLPLAVGVFFLFLGDDLLTAVRSYANYLSLFVISSATYYLLSKDRAVFTWAYEKTVLVWGAVGAIQSFISKDFLTGILPRGEGTAGLGGRGVVGLAPEPTFYGLWCIFMLLIGSLAFEKNKRWIVWLLLVQIFVFSRSSMCVLLALIFLGYYALLSLNSVKRVVNAAILTLLGTALGLAVYSSFRATIEATRTYYLASLALNNPKLLVEVDASTNERLSHLYFSFQGFFENWGLPHGYTAWAAYVNRNFFSTDNTLFWRNTGSFSRIMSGYGAAVFEMGFVGLAVPAAINWALYARLKGDARSFLLHALFLNTVLLTAIPLAMPLLGVIVGCSLAYANRATATQVGGGRA